MSGSIVADGSARRTPTGRGKGHAHAAVVRRARHAPPAIGQTRMLRSRCPNLTSPAPLACVDDTFGLGTSRRNGDRVRLITRGAGQFAERPLWL